MSSADFDMDGFNDIIIGAPYNDSLDGENVDTGAVYVFNGSASLPRFLRGANFTRAGENEHDHLGWAVSNAFDLNSDNIEEIIVGAPHFDNGTINNAGKAYIFYIDIPELPNSNLLITIFILLVIIWKVELKNRRSRNRKF
jgi:hypothetical protein